MDTAMQVRSASRLQRVAVAVLVVVTASMSYGLVQLRHASGAGLATELSAVVDGSGRLARGSHALTARRLRTGRYLVTFDRRVDNCAIVASIGFDGTLTSEQHDGLGPFGDTISYTVLDKQSGESTATVLFLTENLTNSGTPAGTPIGHTNADSDFHVIVLCP